MAETTARQQRGRPFRPGQSGNPRGRPIGSRHKLGEDFISALQADFRANGMKAIEECRESSPAAYLKIVASLIPKDHRLVLGDAADSMTDEQIKERIKALASRLGVFVQATPEETARLEELRRINARKTVPRTDILPAHLSEVGARAGEEDEIEA